VVFVKVYCVLVRPDCAGKAGIGLQCSYLEHRGINLQCLGLYASLCTQL
jgi:hypothetical protein